MYRDIPEELRGLIEPVVDGAGFELVDVTMTRGRPPWMLRVTIDTPEGDGRVPVERCAAVSREIESNLDAADAIPSSYRLEVSSPGLDRPLFTPAQYERHVGAEVLVKLHSSFEGRRKLQDELAGMRDGAETGVAGPSEDAFELLRRMADLGRIEPDADDPVAMRQRMTVGDAWKNRHEPPSSRVIMI